MTCRQCYWCIVLYSQQRGTVCRSSSLFSIATRCRVSASVTSSSSSRRRRRWILSVQLTFVCSQRLWPTLLHVTRSVIKVDAAQFIDVLPRQWHRWRTGGRRCSPTFAYWCRCSQVSAGGAGQQRRRRCGASDLSLVARVLREGGGADNAKLENNKPKTHTK